MFPEEGRTPEEISAAPLVPSMVHARLALPHGIIGAEPRVYSRTQADHVTSIRAFPQIISHSFWVREP